jgi:hypothetical protein
MIGLFSVDSSGKSGKLVKEKDSTVLLALLPYLSLGIHTIIILFLNG